MDSGRNNRSITDINSRRETLNSRDANNSRDTNNCISTNREANSNRNAMNNGCKPLMSFCRKSAKNLSELQKICEKKMQKSKKNFCSIVFIQSDRYRTIRSPQFLV
jgi:hypothetical protein